MHCLCSYIPQIVYLKISIILKELFARINEKTVKMTSGSLVLIRHNIALIDNVDLRFLEKICLVFLILFHSKTFCFKFKFSQLIERR